MLALRLRRWVLTMCASFSRDVRDSEMNGRGCGAAGTVYARWAHGYGLEKHAEHLVVVCMRSVVAMSGVPSGGSFSGSAVILTR